MGLAETLLSALAYPKAQSFNADDESSYRRLIAWLENVKVRHYSKDQRKALDDVRSQSWPDAFSKYLLDLECPIKQTDANKQEVLLWLLSFAVDLEYSDRADQYNAAAASSTQSQQPKDNLEVLPDLHTPEAQQQLSTLCRLLHVDTTKGSLSEHLQAARMLLHKSVLPLIKDPGMQQSLAEGGWQQLPLGFQTGDARVDAAATLLRLLYIKDLQQLQTAIDKVVVQVQEYTANPRTDAALGKVGH